MDKGIKHRNYAFVTNHQPTEICNPGDGSFDFPAPFVSSQLSSILHFGLNSVPPVRTNQFYSSVSQATPKRIGIGSLVINQPFGIFSWSSPSVARHRHLLQCSFNQSNFIWCGRGNVHSQRNTLAVCHHHKLRTLSAFGLTNTCAPFFAGENVPSANVSNHFSRFCTSNSARNTRHTLSQMPFSSQSRSLRQQVLGEGYRFGKSFHRAPARNTHKMPSNTGRFSMGVRPPLGDGFHSGSNGAILAHCLSVSSDFSRVMENSPFHNQLYMSNTCFYEIYSTASSEII